MALLPGRGTPPDASRINAQLDAALGQVASTGDVLNVKEFGATGDGTTDDSAAIQAALDAALSVSSGSTITETVYAPAGTYLCASTLTIPFGVNFCGVPGGTVLDFSSIGESATAIHWGSSVPVPGFTVDGAVISGFTVRGPGKATTGIGIYLAQGLPTKVAQTVMRHVMVDEFGTGVKSGHYAFIMSFEHSQFRNCGVGFEDIGVLTEWGENLAFTFCIFGRNDKHLNINPGAGGVVDYLFESCSFDFASQEPQITVGSASNIMFAACHFETDNVGTSGNPFLMEIVFFLDCLTFIGSQFVMHRAPAGIPIAWTSGANALSMTPLFINCRVQNPGPAFYGANATGAGTQPIAIAIGSPTVTGTRLKRLGAFNSAAMITPSALSRGNNNDYAPGDGDGLRLTGARGGSTITGISGGVSGRRLRLVNISGATITLADQDSDSAAANRFLHPAGSSPALGRNDVADLEYDSTTARWRIVNVLQ